MSEIDAEYGKAVGMLASLSGGERMLDINADGVLSERMLRDDMSYAGALKMLAGVPQARDAAQHISVYHALERMPITHEFSKEVVGAEHELDAVLAGVESAIGGIADQVEEAIVRKAPGSVLVTLSLQDQISELEKISIGLDEGAFDRNRMQIIEKEIRSLKALASAGRKQKEGQGDLVELRDRRLAEVMLKLKLR